MTEFISGPYVYPGIWFLAPDPVYCALFHHDKHAHCLIYEWSKRRYFVRRPVFPNKYEYQYFINGPAIQKLLHLDGLPVWYWRFIYTTMNRCGRTVPEYSIPKIVFEDEAYRSWAYSEGNLCAVRRFYQCTHPQAQYKLGRPFWWS